MTELFGRLAPGADVESARAELRAVHGAIVKEHPGGVPGRSPTSASTPSGCAIRSRRGRARCCSSCSRRPASCSSSPVERREPDPRAIGAARIASSRCAPRSAPARATLRRTLLAESLVLCGTGAVLGVAIARPMVAVLGRYASRFSVRALDLTLDASMLWVGVGLALLAAVAARVRAAPAERRRVARLRAVERRPAHHRRDQPPAADVRGHADRRVVRAAGRRRHAADDAARAPGDAARIRDQRRARGQRAGDRRSGRRPSRFAASTARSSGACSEVPGVERVAFGSTVPWRDAGSFGGGLAVLGRRTHARERPGRSARALPIGVARLLRGARHADRRRTRLHRRRPDGRRDAS